MQPKLLIIGGGGHCRSCLDVIRCENKYSIYGILDDGLVRDGVRDMLGYPVLGGLECIEKLRSEVEFAFVAIGQVKTPQTRMVVYERLKAANYTLPSIISPLAHIALAVCLGEGTIICHYALVNSNSKVGKMCIINSKALIEHDSIVGDFCHLSTCSVINGTCEVGDGSFLGSNMTLPHNTKVPKNSILYYNPLENRYQSPKYRLS